MCGTTSICFLRSTQFGFAWGLLLVAMCGCDLVDSGGAAGYAAESSQKEDGIPEDDIDPSCHYSCAMGRSCEDGQVLRYPGGAVPCEYWTGSQCDPIVEYTCLEGCAFRDSEEVVYPVEFCVEFQPDVAGDPCTSAADCKRPKTKENADGTVTVSYLDCDLALGHCIDSVPPVLPKYLEPLCGLGLESVPLGASGLARVSTCPGDWCLVGPRPDGSCVEQGCTARCEVDQDCPLGSRCDSQPVLIGSELFVQVCKPGPKNQFFQGLTCP